MKNVKLVILLISVFIFKNASAQNSLKKDSIYYLLDTINMPVNDRMVTIETDGKLKFANIKCPCLHNNAYIRFLVSGKTSEIKNVKLKTLNLISLVDLIAFVKKNDDGTDKGNDRFLQQHDVFFIEPLKGKYFMNKVFFLGSGIHVTDEPIYIGPAIKN